MRSLVRRGCAMLFAVTLLFTLSLATEAQTTRLEGVVNVNLATAEQLELLPGIGPTRARAIIDDRKEHGPFKEPADLIRVPGIGERAFARMRPHVAVKGKTTAKVAEED